METSIQISGKTVNIKISPAANRLLDKADKTLIVEMELYFSCLIRKRVRFESGKPSDTSVSINDKLDIQFRPVMTSQCGVDYEGDEPPLTEFPISNASAFVPKWLKLDYRKGSWWGEFGY